MLSFCQNELPFQKTISKIFLWRLWFAKKLYLDFMVLYFQEVLNNIYGCLWQKHLLETTI